MKKPIKILVVDDNPLLLDILKRAARISFPEARFNQVLTTAQAITYIDQLADKQPAFVIASIESEDNISGFNFLAFLKTQTLPVMPPVFMLSTSQLQDDINDAYHFGAASCMGRPHDATGWKHYLAMIRHQYASYL